MPSIGADGDVSVFEAAAEPFVGLVGFDSCDEFVEPASEEFHRLARSDVDNQDVQQLFGGVELEPDEGLVDARGAGLVDVPGLPGVPGVGGFVFESAGDAEGAGDGVFAGCDGEADFEGGEFAGGVAGVGAVAAQVGDALLVELAAGGGELEHQFGVAGLGGGEDLLLVGELVDQCLCGVGGCPHAFYCREGVRQSLLLWTTLTNTCLDAAGLQRSATAVARNALGRAGCAGAAGSWHRDRQGAQGSGDGRDRLGRHRLRPRSSPVENPPGGLK